MLEHIDLKDGVVSYDGFTWLKDYSTFINNIDELTEDLLQISFFEDNYLIDVGWYSDKIFSLQLIKNRDWDNPMKLIKVQTPNEVVDVIPLLIDLLYSEKNHF